MRAFGAVVQGQCRRIELAGVSPVEVGVVFLADLGLRACPQRRAIGDLQGLSVRLLAQVARGGARGVARPRRPGAPDASSV